MTGTDVAVAEPTGQQMSVATMGEEEISRLFRVARALAASGMFKDAHQGEQAFAKILLGRDLGLTPTQAMTGIHIVEGKPEVASVTLGGFVRKTNGYDYSVQWLVRPAPDTEPEWVIDDGGHEVLGCAITFTVEDKVVGVSRWTQTDSARADLERDRGNAKSNHVKYPRNMYWARAMSNGVKWYVPEVTGGVPVYAEGELPRVENLADGEGTGTPPGMQLPPEVEAVMRRARDLGHRGLADRATVEMTLMGQTPERVAAWVANATTDLDRLEPQPDTAPAQGPDKEPDDTPARGSAVHDQFAAAVADLEGGDAEEVDGEVVEEVQQAVAAKGLLDRALAKQDEADAARADGREDDATALEEEADGLRSEAQAMVDPQQSDLGL